jgi:peptide/nickel transport system ATP-binding protein
VYSDKFQAQIDVVDLVVKVPEKRFWYGGIKTYKTLINGVSFSLKPHETLGIIGESGCGKSTLARTLLQLIPASSGQLTYKRIGENRMEQFNVLPSRKFMQLVFQDPFASLNPLMPVGEAIAEALRVHHMESNERLIKQRATFWLEAVGLPASSFLRLPHEFSGGQRQRVSIARALCINPKVLVCDESVSALDVSIQAQILNLINDLKSTLGFSCIFISHDIHVVRYMCQSILVMKAGKIVESGATDVVLQNPQQAYTQTLLQAVPKFEPF